MKFYTVYIYDDENREAEIIGYFDTEEKAKKVQFAIRKYSEEELSNTVYCYIEEGEVNNEPSWWLWNEAKSYYKGD